MVTLVDIKKIKENPNNPRVIKGAKFKKLVKSIQDFPDMLNKRPIVTFTDEDGNYVALGGNMRLKALKELKYKEVPIIIADEWTQEQKDQFLIKDNVGFGEWDWDILANEWDNKKLNDWGLDLVLTDEDIEEMKNPNNSDTENVFATELDMQSNYIVLKFDSDIDWIQAKTLFGLKTETAQRANGKPWSKGIGRVVNGSKAINKLLKV